MTDFNLARFNREQILLEAQDSYALLNQLEEAINGLMSTNTNDDGFLEDLSALLLDAHNRVDLAISAK